MRSNFRQPARPSTRRGSPRRRSVTPVRLDDQNHNAANPDVPDANRAGSSAGPSRQKKLLPVAHSSRAKFPATKKMKRTRREVSFDEIEENLGDGGPVAEIQPSPGQNNNMEMDQNEPELHVDDEFGLELGPIPHGTKWKVDYEHPNSKQMKYCSTFFRTTDQVMDEIIKSCPAAIQAKIRRNQTTKLRGQSEEIATIVLKAYVLDPIDNSRSEIDSLEIWSHHSGNEMKINWPVIDLNDHEIPAHEKLWAEYRKPVDEYILTDEEYQLKAEKAAKEAERAETAQLLVEKEKEIERLIRILHQENEKLNKLEEEINKNKEALISMRDDLLRKKNADKENENKVKDERIRHLEEQTTKLKEDILQRDETIREMTGEMKRKNDMIAGSNRTAREKEQMMRRDEEERQETREELRRTKMELLDTQRQLEDLERRYAAAASELANLKADFLANYEIYENRATSARQLEAATQQIAELKSELERYKKPEEENVN